MGTLVRGVTAPDLVQVLVVDDDELLRELTVSVLRSHGVAVEAVENGRDALETLERLPAKPRVILLDMTMPEMSGPELLDELRRRGTLDEVPVIAVTAMRPGHDDLPDDGVDSYLRKPFGVDELLAVVARYCGPS